MRILYPELMKNCYYCGLCASQGYDAIRHRYVCIEDKSCKHKDFEESKEHHQIFEEFMDDYEYQNPNWWKNKIYKLDRCMWKHKIHLARHNHKVG